MRVAAALLVTLGLLFPARASTVPQPHGIPGAWSLKFRDEFSGPTVNLAHWQPNWLAGNNTDRTPPDNSDDINCESPANVNQSGGYLNLASSEAPCTDDQGHQYQWTSGLVNSHSHYTFRYGVIEARIYVVTNPCVDFPAFWADGSETGGVTWPTFGEADVYECLDDGPNWHFHSPSGAPGAEVNLATGWHTFAVNIQRGAATCAGGTPDSVTASFYYDGKNVGGTSACIKDTGFYVIVDNDVSYKHGGLIEPDVMKVDYVRAWQ